MGENNGLFLNDLDAETYLWTSWTRVRGPERRVTRYKVSCTSTSVVMKSLQLRVLHNETMNCTKELCIGKLLGILFTSDVSHSKVGIGIL